MAELSKAKFKVFKEDGSVRPDHRAVQPDHASAFEKPVQTADITIPGLDSPLKQFVRGRRRDRRRVELFFDTTETGHRSRRDQRHHADRRVLRAGEDRPEDARRPGLLVHLGREVPRRPAAGALRQPAPHRVPLRGHQRQAGLQAASAPRARRCAPSLTLKLEEYVALDRQIAAAQPAVVRPHPQPRARAGRVAGAGRRGSYLHDPREWRHLADANDVDDPRRLTPGLTLTIPPLT